MKKSVFAILLLMFFIKIVSSGSIGITPAYFKEFFEPGLERTYTFEVTSLERTDLKIYVTGDLAEYVNLTESLIKGKGKFDARIKLPEYIEKPGTHSIYIGAIESKEEIEGKMMIGGVAAVQAKVDILVPYPGIYLEYSFDIKSINEGEKTEMELKLDNLGTEDISIKPSIKIYDKNETKVLLNEELEKVFLKTKESKTIRKSLETQNFAPGEYFGILTLEYENKTDKSIKDFKVGVFFVEITDYSYLFERGKINPFLIEIESKWNTKIEKVYAEIAITYEGVLIQKFQTFSTSLEPWEKKNLTGYIDTTELETKRYTANIKVFYEGSSTNKLVAIYIQNPPKKEKLLYILLGVVLLIALIAIISLIIKTKKLRYEKKK
jgi:hypothetical protein